MVIMENHVCHSCLTQNHVTKAKQSARVAPIVNGQLTNQSSESTAPHATSGSFQIFWSAPNETQTVTKGNEWSGTNAAGSNKGRT